MEEIVKIKSVGNVTHDVKQFIVEKPSGYEFKPGQATEVSINKEEWKDEKRPFTFTSLNESEDLEFTIKIYPDHDGVTEQLGKLQPGDELIVRDTWGAIEYKGPGYILAGGAGITPYIAILRDLDKKNEVKGNHLFFANKTDKDIILKNELDSIMGNDATYVITDQDDTAYTKAYLDEDFLKKNIKDFNKRFYVCGPPEMTEEISKTLKKLGANPDSVQLDDQ
ncbi:FAD-binding oxidoreductase [Christiangramia sediminicola]|uniref:FAD-binding oxidoreductase n=1 Tax=Christiangramia sediminicola TaxID=3073267 RepID=A0ABU1EL05_9FLAO|nr:FAD-binding oxidoreductase [Christiangramia sp. SM2212]MDR5589065.1 FAD-binding oxidoreductase [Christiangramia sp. SM2212]